jgi:hypothetical protein
LYDMMDNFIQHLFTLLLIKDAPNSNLIGKQNMIKTTKCGN